MTVPSNVSHEQLAAWGRLGGKARAAKYTHEQLQQMHTDHAKNQEKADRLYAFLREYIAAKGCAPSGPEISDALHQNRDKTTKKLLQILQRAGRIQLHPWRRGITLTQAEKPREIALSFGVEPAGPISASILIPRSTRKCYDCDEPAVEGKTRCERHLHRASASSCRSHKGAYAQKKRGGTCVNCAEPAVVGKVQCELHLRLNRENARVMRQNRPKV